MTLFVLLFRRLGQSWRWLLAQLILTPLLIALGILWTRIPEKNFLSVAATLLLPLLMAISFLELEAGTLRCFADDEGKRVKLVWGAMGLLAAALLLWVASGMIDDFADHNLNWASYLNSKSPAHTRWLTFDRYSRALTLAAWILRWLLLPALLLPLAASLAQWGHRIEWRRIFRLWIDWKWWAGVLIAALLGVLWPSYFFDGLPKGSVSAQEWHLGLKLGAAFLLKLTSWVLLIAWMGVLFTRIPATPRSAEAEQFCRNLRASWKLALAVIGIFCLFSLPIWPLHEVGTADVVGKLGTGLRITASAVVFVLLILQTRRMFAHAMQLTKIYWGILAPIVWFAITFAVASQDERFPLPVVHWGWGDFITFVFLAPFVAAAAAWGWLLPWKSILKLFRNPRWMAAGVATFVANTYLSSPIADQFAPPASGAGLSRLHDFVAMTISFAVILLEVAWLAALLAPPTSEAVVPAPGAPEPPAE